MKNEVYYRNKAVNGLKLAYREAGDPNNTTLVLLHGFPTSSHMYRKVLTTLSDEFHLVAPDYPGFGDSDFPDPNTFNYTFDELANHTNALIESLGIKQYVIMMQDYGGPVGFRLATSHPERILGIITQNANAYEEGLGEGWGAIKALWANRNETTEQALVGALSLDGLQWQYTHGTRNPEQVNPDNWNLDFLRMQRPGAHQAHFDLFYDYQNNVSLYPKWQAYMRDHQPPLLVVWGKNDVYFPEPGAEAYKRDIQQVDYHIYDTGHFALEEDGEDIIGKIRIFMRNIKS